MDLRVRPCAACARRKWQAAIAAGGAVVAVCLLVELALIRLGIDDVDEGYFLEQAARLLRGELPYRDFDSLYTPGLLYLHGALEYLNGSLHVLPLRAVALTARVVVAGLLVVLARHIARPAYAVLPALYLLIGLDPAPVNWEPHPGWEALAATLVVLWLGPHLHRAEARQKPWLLMVLGALVAVAFLFKQNAGAFLGVSLATWILLRGVDATPRAPGRNLRVAQIVGSAAVLLMLGGLVTPAGDVVLALYVLAPVAVSLGLLLREQRAAPDGEPLMTRVWAIAWLTFGFCIATLPWLLVLLRALDWQVTLLSGFVGAVNQRALAAPLERPPGPAWIVLAIALASGVSAVRTRGRASQVFAIIALASVAVACLIAWPVDAPAPGAAGIALGNSVLGLQPTLPALSWIGGVWLARRWRTGPRAYWLRWFLLVGSFTLLTQYPRADNFHLIWSAPPLLMVGAAALDQVQRWLASRWRLSLPRGRALAGLLVGAVMLTALPTSQWRAQLIVRGNIENGLPRWNDWGPLTGAAPLLGITATEDASRDFDAVIQHVTTRLRPDEPLFVYPASALLYPATDRRNPTRFTHLYPGAATPEQVAAVVETLQTLPVRIVIISDVLLGAFGPSGVNVPLEEYLANAYEVTARFGPYVVFERVG